MIDALATQRHLVDHVAPIWTALPEDLRGTFFIPKPRMAEYAYATYGIRSSQAFPHWPGPAVIVANHSDYMQTGPRAVLYVEHGAGQTYADWPAHPSYSGGGERDRVGLFLTLNEVTAARERGRYPDAAVQVVGSAHLDVLDAALHGTRQDTDILAVTWHWRATLVPETYWAWDDWRRYIGQMAHDGWFILGHAHPRAFPELKRQYERLGIRPVLDPVAVLQHSSVLLFDNTSMGYEAAALGWPVVALNALRYRKDVHHGLRFWDLLPGPTVDPTAAAVDDLTAAIAEARSEEWVDRRAAVSDQVYPPHTRGRAAELARDAILDWLTTIPGRRSTIT